MSKNTDKNDARVQRIEDGLSSLVKMLILIPDDVDDPVKDPRHISGLELVRNIIEGHESPAGELDADHISDLITNKLRHEYNSPGQADQFSDAYARLAPQSVLARKGGTLYLLHLLATPDDGWLSGSPAASEDGHQSPQTTIRRPEAIPPDPVPLVSPRGFSTAELPRLPSYHNPSTNIAQAKSPKERVNRREPEEVHEALREVPYPEHVDFQALPTEAALLRDLPFTLQGLSTKHLRFTSSFEIEIPPRLPLPLVSLLHTLAEPSLLYRGLSETVQAPVEGLIAQSLMSALGIELRSYLALIATLEGEIRRFLTSLDGAEHRSAVRKVGVTLKRCVIWTREATLGLRLMSLMVEGAKQRKGGRLISFIHQLSSHGDPFVATFAARILVHVTKLFYEMLRQWIYDGELADPYYEFFVIEQETPNGDQEGTESGKQPPPNEWEDKYELKKEMVPTFMTRDLGKKSFSIGKSLNFLRYGCQDAAWVEGYCKDATRELHYGDIAALDSSIDKAYKTTMGRVTYLMSTKFHLFQHLQALKKYLLLGQGDFVALLMESLAPSLDWPAGSQYRHVLTGQLDTAIRGSNAQYDPDEILHRLDAKILERSSGDVGWDVFSLDYRIDPPLNVIITPWATRKYLTMFNFLWRVKRVEFAMGSTWRRCMTGARGVLADLNDQMVRDWKAARCCMAEMIHFINQLQYYILFEVIEASWDQLQAAINKPDCTLDGLIEAHSRYLESITRKGLFDTPRHAITGKVEDGFPSQLHYILKNMLAYRDAVDGLYSFSVADFTRRQQSSVQAETRADELLRSPSRATAKSSRSARQPLKGRTDSPFPANDILMGASPSESDDQMLSALRARLEELSDDFQGRIATLLGDLAFQPDLNMRFLGVVMNFNNVYQPRKRRREPSRKEDRKTPEPGALADPLATGHENNGEGGVETETGGEIENRRVASRSEAVPKKSRRDRERGHDDRNEDGNANANATSIESARIVRRPSKRKEEKREGKDDDTSKEARGSGSGTARISSRVISSRSGVTKRKESTNHEREQQQQEQERQGDKEDLDDGRRNDGAVAAGEKPRIAISRSEARHSHQHHHHQKQHSDGTKHHEDKERERRGGGGGGAGGGGGGSGGGGGGGGGRVSGSGSGGGNQDAVGNPKLGPTSSSTTSSSSRQHQHPASSGSKRGEGKLHQQQPQAQMQEQGQEQGQEQEE